MAETLGWYLRGYEENEHLEAFARLGKAYRKIESDRIIDMRNYNNYLEGLKNGS